MGEIADYYVEQMIGESFRSYRPRPKSKGFQSGVGFLRWKTADGTIVEMSDMTIPHLNNALRLCDKYGGSGKAREIRTHLAHRAKQQQKPEEKLFDLGDWS